MAGLSIEELLASHCDKAAVRNNGGGFYNHKLFWSVMAAPGNGGGGVIVGSVIDTAIKKNFGSFEKFKEAFAEAAATRFGSGWAWLCVHAGGKLEVCSTANQDNPLMPQVGCSGTPILGLDVWEHAYYLNYQNRRPAYIDAFWNVVNWAEVERGYEAHSDSFWTPFNPASRGFFVGQGILIHLVCGRRLLHFGSAPRGTGQSIQQGARKKVRRMARPDKGRCGCALCGGRSV